MVLTTNGVIVEVTSLWDIGSDRLNPERSLERISLLTGKGQG